MTQTPREPPVCDLLVDGRPLPLDVRRLIQSIAITGPADGAKQLDVVLQACDNAQTGYRVIDERLLFPGKTIVVEAGYGKKRVPKGRFKVKTHRTKYGNPPTVVVQAYDGLAALLEGTDALLFEGKTSNSEVVEALLREKYPTMGWYIADSPPREGDRFKAVNDTDLQFVKVMAEADGFAYPRVWSREQYEYAWGQNQQSGRRLPEGSANIRDEMLIYAPLSDVFALSPQLRLAYSLPNKGGDWASLDIDFSTDGIPTAVEVYGVTRALGGLQVAKIVVEITADGPEVKSVEPMTGDKWSTQEKIKDKVSSGTALCIYALSDAKRVVATGGTYQYHSGGGEVIKGTQTYYTKKGKEKTRTVKRRTATGEIVTKASEASVREVLAGYTIETDQDALDFAKKWLQARAASYLVAKGTLKNIPGIEGMDTAQVHEIVGVAELHAGGYATLDVDHKWTREGGHDVSVAAQKLIEESGLPPAGATFAAYPEALGEE